MALDRQLEGLAFTPEEVQAMTSAYEAILDELGLTDRSDPLAETIARKVITFCQVDGCDLTSLRDLVLKDLRG